MSYFVETLSKTGEWVRCRRHISGVFTGSDLDIDSDLHSGRPTEFFDLAEAKTFLDWIWKQRLEGIEGVRVVAPVIGIVRWKAVHSTGRSR